jgi:glycine amidinotransferase
LRIENSQSALSSSLITAPEGGVLNERRCNYDEYGKLTKVVIGVPDRSMLPLFKDSVIVKNQVLDFIPFMLPLCSKENIYNTVLSSFPNLQYVVPYSGSYYYNNLINDAKKESDNLEYILNKQGVETFRPDPSKLRHNYSLNDWSCNSHFNCNNPRDVFFTYHNLIVETPMAERSRYYENECYSDILYNNNELEHYVMPKSKMLDSLYTEPTYITNNSDYAMDAADCLKIGKHLFIQRSVVTNDYTIEYLKNKLAKYGFHVHKLYFNDSHPHHIDATLNTIKPGVFIENPTRPMNNKSNKQLIKCGWKFYKAPVSNQNNTLLCSRWLNMNWLQIDERTIVIEEKEKDTINFLESLGMKCIPIPYKNNYIFGGGIHCSTLDLHRENQQALNYGFETLSF